MSEWADEMGIKYKTLKARINRYNWSIERAIGLPVRKTTI